MHTPLSILDLELPYDIHTAMPRGGFDLSTNGQMSISSHDHSNAAVDVVRSTAFTFLDRIHGYTTRQRVIPA
jgi:hypothetical protein